MWCFLMQMDCIPKNIRDVIHLYVRGCYFIHLSDFGTISFVESVNSNIVAHKMRKGAHFGARFLLF